MPDTHGIMPPPSHTHTNDNAACFKGKTHLLGFQPGVSEESHNNKINHLYEVLA